MIRQHSVTDAPSFVACLRKAVEKPESMVLSVGFTCLDSRVIGMAGHLIWRDAEVWEFAVINIQNIIPTLETGRFRTLFPGLLDALRSAESLFAVVFRLQLWFNSAKGVFVGAYGPVFIQYYIFDIEEYRMVLYGNGQTWAPDLSLHENARSHTYGAILFEPPSKADRPLQLATLSDVVQRNWRAFASYNSIPAGLSFQFYVPFFLHPGVRRSRGAITAAARDFVFSEVHSFFQKPELGSMLVLEETRVSVGLVAGERACRIQFAVANLTGDSPRAHYNRRAFVEILA